MWERRLMAWLSEPVFVPWWGVILIFGGLLATLGVIIAEVS